MFPRISLSIFLVLGFAAQNVSAQVFINEIHYDNASTDTGEAIEVAAAAGTNLSGYRLVLYNGNGGGTYNTVDLSGVIADQQDGYGTASFLIAGIQNGSPDGVALVDAGDNSIEVYPSEA